MKSLSAKEVYEKLHSEEDVVLINALGPNSFQAKHIPGSINIPAGEIEERAGQILPAKNQQIIVYCSSPSCTASPTAAKKLTELGYSNVVDFEAGLTGWLKEGYSLTRGNFHN